MSMSEITKARWASGDLKGKKCEPGCTCGRHKQKITEEGKKRKSEATKKAWAEGVFDNRRKPPTREEMSAEHRKKLSETRKKLWREGVYDNARPASRRRVSNHEYGLAPYLEALGYRHNDDGHTFIAKRVPDFVDIEGRRVFEYFGRFWHPRSEEEKEIIDFYKSYGWECTVLWEDDLHDFLDRHNDLVGEQERVKAWKFAKVNFGYQPIPEKYQKLLDTTTV